MSVRTVVVAHAEALVAEGLTAALETFPEIVVRAPATTRAAALRHVGHVDAVAIDARLDGADDLATRMRAGGSRVVLVGGPEEGEDDVVRVPTNARVAALADALVPGVVPCAPSALSEQQRRVLHLVARGLTAKQMATQLGISSKTVEQHKSRIFRKLGVPNQAAAVRVASAMGITGGLR